LAWGVGHAWGEQIDQCSGEVHPRLLGGDKPRPYESGTTLKGRTTKKLRRPAEVGAGATDGYAGTVCYIMW